MTILQQGQKAMKPRLRLNDFKLFSYNCIYFLITVYMKMIFIFTQLHTQTCLSSKFSLVLFLSSFSIHNTHPKLCLNQHHSQMKNSNYCCYDCFPLFFWKITEERQDHKMPYLILICNLLFMSLKFHLFGS